jgi:hypothetical protein
MRLSSAKENAKVSARDSGRQVEFRRARSGRSGMHAAAIPWSRGFAAWFALLALVLHISASALCCPAQKAAAEQLSAGFSICHASQESEPGSHDRDQPSPKGHGCPICQNLSHSTFVPPPPSTSLTAPVSAATKIEGPLLGARFADKCVAAAQPRGPPLEI